MTEKQVQVEVEIPPEIKKINSLLEESIMDSTQLIKVKIAMVDIIGIYFGKGFDEGIAALQEQLEEQGIYEIKKDQKDQKKLKEIK